MSDNRLRCVLAYRVQPNPSFGSGESGDGGDGGDGIAMSDLSLSDSKAEVTILAKHDHAAQYETHAGASSDAGSLYGGRDKSFAEAVALVIGKDPPALASAGGGIGGFKVTQSEMHQVVYGADSDGICLAVITGQKYPTRVSISMLSELYDQFSKNFGAAARAAAANSLTKKCKPMLSSICQKYDDLKQIDKTSALLDKVETVKGTMQGNIANMLKNTEKADAIAMQSDQLAEQASVFKKKSTDLRRNMRCKNMKMTIILGLLITGILLIILVPLILRAKKAASNEN